jgi:hypothetical protein
LLKRYDATYTTRSAVMARRTKKTKLSNFMVKVWLKAVGVWK